MERKNILFTGLPGCGKTTIIEKIVGQTKRPCIGFFTREIREKGQRVGFFINTLDGKQGILAHINTESRYRVGKYGVSTNDVDRIAVPAMIAANEDEIVVIDEIGKMECFSDLFRDTVMRILNSRQRVLGSISLKGDAFIQRIKERKDVLLIRVSETNRNMLAEKVSGMFAELEF